MSEWGGGLPGACPRSASELLLQLLSLASNVSFSCVLTGSVLLHSQVLRAGVRSSLDVRVLRPDRLLQHQGRLASVSIMKACSTTVLHGVAAACPSSSLKLCSGSSGRPLSPHMSTPVALALQRREESH